MAVGTIQRSVLTDIANAIRVQNAVRSMFSPKGTDTTTPSATRSAIMGEVLAYAGRSKA